MKKISFLVIALLSLAGIRTMAQPGQQMPVEDRVKRTIERLTPALSLTEKQVATLTLCTPNITQKWINSAAAVRPHRPKTDKNSPAPAMKN